VGSLIRGRAFQSLRAVSGDLRRFFGRCSIKGSKNLYETLLVQRNSHHTVVDYIRSFQNGEEKGFNFFFRQFYAPLCYYVFQFVKDKADAEEIAGDTLMKFWERRENFDNFPSIKSFLYTAARNASLNRIRQQKRYENRITELKHITEKNEQTVIHQIIEAEIYREIVTILKTLPPQCRKIFSMLFLEGKDYRQIADELNLSIGTVRSQKARAITIIKQRLVSLFLIVVFVSLF